MKALVLSKKDHFPTFESTEIPKPDEGEVIVTLTASALNHRDVWITKGMYPGIRYPIILGSDGTGVLDGKRIIINPSLDWGNDQRFQAKSYSILGLPQNGTFAEYSSVKEENVYPAPKHLSDEEVAALPLAGLTAFRALVKKGAPLKSDRIFINGIGGGVALFALQFAKAMGLDVFVSSGSDHKIEKAIELGAKGGVNYKNENWSKSLQKETGGFDVLIDGAGGKGFHHLVRLANPGARIVIYGGTKGPIAQLNTQQLFWKQISVLGSTMGSDQDFKQMLEMVNKYEIRPVIDSVFPLAEGFKAFERMDQGLQFGKIVLKHA